MLTAEYKALQYSPLLSPLAHHKQLFRSEYLRPPVGNMGTPTSACASDMEMAKDALPDFSMFTLSFASNKSQGTCRRRARYPPKARLKVSKIRERGACLRCSLKKIPCSPDDLCTTCLKATLSRSYSHERRVLGFIACVRTSLSQASVFPHGKELFRGSYTCIKNTGC